MSARLARVARVALLAFTFGMVAPSVADAATDASVATTPTTTAPAPAPKPDPEVTPKPPGKSKAVAPAPAPAPAPTSKTALGKLSTELMNIIVPALVTLIGGLVVAVLGWVRKRFKLNVSDQQLWSWAAIAQRASMRAGEWARNKVSAAADTKKVPGPEVLEVAVNWAVEMGKSLKLPEMGREKLIGLIEAHLFEERSRVAEKNGPYAK